MKNLIWIDLETTGLDPVNDDILEVAVVSTDKNLKILESVSTVVFSEKVYEHWHSVKRGRGFPAWILKQHETLLHESMTKGMLLVEAQDVVRKVIQANTSADDLSPLCGSSVHFDRSFMRTHMPSALHCLHYRNYDVSSFKIEHELLERESFSDYKKRKGTLKEKQHRALPDLLDSIEEMKYYRDFISL